MFFYIKDNIVRLGRLDFKLDEKEVIRCSNEEAYELKKQLKDIGINCKVTFLKRIIDFYKQAQGQTHYITKNTLLDDIENGKKIYFNSYSKK